LRLSLSPDDLGLLLLLSCFDDKLSALSLLLGDLLLFDGSSVFLSELKLGDGGVFEHNHKVAESVLETVADLGTDLLTLGSEGVGRVTCNDRSQDLVDNRGQDTSMVVATKLSVNREELFVIRSEHDSQRDVDHL
jgi:hypothetical protein